MSIGTMDLAPLLYISRTMEQTFFLLVHGLLLTIPEISLRSL
jgi:hypothetical protein